MSYVFIWVVPRRLYFKFHRFGTLSVPSSEKYRTIPRLWFESFHALQISQPLLTLRTDSRMKIEHTECSETLAFKLQMPGNNPKEKIRHSSTYFRIRKAESATTVKSDTNLKM
jgi:hypothetical protein